MAGDVLFFPLLGVHKSWTGVEWGWEKGLPHMIQGWLSKNPCNVLSGEPHENQEGWTLLLPQTF